MSLVDARLCRFIASRVTDGFRGGGRVKGLKRAASVTEHFLPLVPELPGKLLMSLMVHRYAAPARGPRSGHQPRSVRKDSSLRQAGKETSSLTVGSLYLR